MFTDEKHIVATMCKNVLMHVAMYMHLEEKASCEKANTIWFFFFFFIYMVLLIKGTLCGPAHKDRELNTGCHGLEERLTKTYSLMDLHFQF